MLSLQTISDRLELTQLVTDYATAIDSKQMDLLDTVFAPDAYLDYRVFGGIDGDYPTVKAWLGEVLPRFPAFQHLNGNLDFRINGDEATGRVMCLNPVEMPSPTGPSQFVFIGLWYIDAYRRAPQGWRIVRRSEVRSFYQSVGSVSAAAP